MFQLCFILNIPSNGPILTGQLVKCSVRRIQLPQKVRGALLTGVGALIRLNTVNAHSGVDGEVQAAYAKTKQKQYQWSKRKQKIGSELTER